MFRLNSEFSVLVSLTFRVLSGNFGITQFYKFMTDICNSLIVETLNSITLILTNI